MHVIFEHQGDGKNDPEQCRDWRLADCDWLEEWPHDREGTAMSHAHGVVRLWTDRLGQKRVGFDPDADRTDDPGLPNVEILSVEPEDDDA